MNIIIDEQTHQDLQKQILNTIEFGSAMKGKQTEDSDHDYLHIIHTSLNWLGYPFNTHHLLQFRAENGDDHIYCNANTFVKSLLDGDSTIFHEMVRYKALEGTCLEPLLQYDFAHYKTLRGYLGLARRDLKEATKIYNKDPRKALKKFRFSLEGVNYVRGVLGYEDSIGYLDPADIFTLQDVCKDLSREVEALRDKMSIMLDNGSVPRTVDLETLEKLCVFLEHFNVRGGYFITGLDYFMEAHNNGN